MAFAESLVVFLADFGVSVTAGAVSGFGILDMPGDLVADGMIITTDYSLRCEASEFGGLIYGAAMTVDGVNYQVRENRLIEDGVFCEITLLKVAADSSAAGQDPRTFGLADLSDVNITSADQGDVLIYNNGQWVDASDSKSVTIAGPQAGDSFTLFRTARSTTIAEVVALVSGGSVTYELRYDANRTSAGALAIVPDTVTNTTTGDTATVQNQPIASGRFVWVEITAVSGTVDEFNLSVSF